jgi:hypothetical protein
MPPHADVLQWEHLPFPKSLREFQRLFPTDTACAILSYRFLNDTSQWSRRQSMSIREDKFTKRNRGKYAVRHAGILVMRAFDTRAAAEEWARWNYRARSSWEIEQL